MQAQSQEPQGRFLKSHPQYTFIHDVKCPDPKLNTYIAARTCFNSLPTSSLDADQSRQLVDPDQDPNCLTL